MHHESHERDVKHLYSIRTYRQNPAIPMTKKKGSASDEVAPTKHEQPLQAILLADSFTHNFRPLSLDRPKMLCPLNNVAMIDYAMDFVAGAGVEELFVVCVSDHVEAYVEQHSWTATKMQVTVVKDSTLTNAGDALREIDKRNLIQSDPFILLFGDVVTNVDLVGALAAHKERHKKDSSAIMTLLMKEVGPSCDRFVSSIRANTEDLVVGLDPTQDNRILVYDDNSENKSIPVPCSFLASHPQIDLRYDLLDCGIDICSPDVLARMADEFDYRDIRREFVANSVAEEEEGLQNKIYAHFLKSNEYAARVHDFATYASVSKDLLRRWCYPVVPENLPSGYEKQYRYTLQRHYLYMERKNGTSRVGRSSKIQGVGMIGSSCAIGEDCRVEGTVIGNFCRIEDKATVLGSHLWDAVEVGAGATVIQSILADGCIVMAGAVVSRGCIIGAGVVVGSDVVLPEFTKLTLKEEKEDDFGDDWEEDGESNDDGLDKSGEDSSSPRETQIVSDLDVVGSDGKGRVWKVAPEDDVEEMAEGFSEVLKARSIGFDPASFFQARYQHQQEGEDDLSDDDDDDEGFANMDTDLSDYGDGSVTFGVEDSVVVDEAPVIVGRQKGVDVIKELKLICLEFESTGPIENLAIELNSFKFSQNATYSDCTMAAMLAILEKMKITKGTTDGKLVAEFKSYLERWGPLLRKMSIGLEEEKAIVLALERSATQESEMGEYLSTGTSFRFLLQTLHDEEIVSEDSILDWATERRNNQDVDSGVTKLFRLKPVQDFLEWLEEESEEESDDDADSEDEE